MSRYNVSWGIVETHGRASLLFTGMLIEKIIELFLNRMSAEHKARLLETAVDKFFAGMTPDEKQQFVEMLMRRVLDEVDAKVVFPQIMAMMWKEAGDSALMGKMTKAAAQTGGKISEVVGEFIRGSRREE